MKHNIKTFYYKKISLQLSFVNIKGWLGQKYLGFEVYKWEQKHALIDVFHKTFSTAETFGMKPYEHTV